MPTSLLTRAFGVVAALTGTLVLIRSVSGFFDLVGPLPSFALAFLLTLVLGLIVAAGGIVIVLNTLIRKPLVSNETTFGRVLIRILAATAFVTGSLLLLLGYLDSTDRSSIESRHFSGAQLLRQ